ncbi:MAG: hypothetical protein MUD11_15125 [Rhodobacteraceae bacterium]|nr:hypothetical protein [Paracoccaceae bacterium]
MSNNDSFIDEVTEEVRRDKLFALFRKYGWIGIVAVLGIVGGTAWNEWQQSQQEARAQTFGNAVLDAFDLGAPAERIAALRDVPATGAQAGLLGLMLSTDPEADKTAALAALDAVAADQALAPVYRDLAVLRRVLVAGTEMPLAERRTALEGIAVAGRPYRVLAQEQLAILLIEEGDSAGAIAMLTSLLSDQEASVGLRARAGQLIVALGGSLPEAG